MKQIFQHLNTGTIELVEVPIPQVQPGHLLVKTSLSLISAGTERMVMDFGKASYLQKAKHQPEKVRQVVDKLQTDGILPTVEAIRSKLAAGVL